MDVDSPDFIVRREDDENSAAATVLERGLSTEGEAVAGPRDKQALLLFARDSEDVVVGGLRGDTVWGWLQIGRLWVRPDDRGKGSARC